LEPSHTRCRTARPLVTQYACAVAGGDGEAGERVAGEIEQGLGAAGLNPARLDLERQNAHEAFAGAFATAVAAAPSPAVHAAHAAGAKRGGAPLVCGAGGDLGVATGVLEVPHRGCLRLPPPCA